MGIRKNINCLTADELHDLREAIVCIYNFPDAYPFSIYTILGLHNDLPIS